MKISTAIIGIALFCHSDDDPIWMGNRKTKESDK